MTREKYLVWTMRVVGGVMLLAFGAVVMPTSLMASMHAWLGLGSFPESPLVDYLARSASVLYGIHGGLLWVLSTDVRRFAAAIRYLALMNLVLGVVMTVIDIGAPMPLWWTATEGPPIFAVGLLFLYLLRAVPDER